ncbi:G2/M phase-specific E3 ubiquitin-protein ligase-like [Megalobrama amblycephala]|uniref:G2/M phase-specific E3 ubiquitin-protein ligase-like n=1 Tax=Megalobrama amblycephala TaxID=75352 RepID=UPI0020140A46|nr:G2/M phase-specific E3 ubiquitin-protein ligase-like [Megalobrama amblycephala]
MLGSPDYTNSDSEEADLADILRSFQKDHLDTENCAIVVARRSKILHSACQALSKSYFAWHRTPRIEFVGESAEDHGGPQREFFRLLMIEAQSALGIFEGKQGQVFFAYNQSALEQNRFYTCGKLIAWSLIHGGPGIKALHPTLYLLMCGQEGQLDRFDFQDLPDDEVQLKLQQIKQCKSVGDLISLKASLGDWIAECGVPWIYNAGLPEMPRVYSLVIKHFIYLRPASMILQFKAGINSCGSLWQTVENNWMAFKPLFTNTQKPLTRNEFKDLLVVNWSDEGSNHRQIEEDTIFAWECLLNSIQEKETSLMFEDLLTFMTGADAVPPLGFPKKAEIDFYTQEDGCRRLPYASTCSMVLFLPRGVLDESELQNLLIDAVKGSVGFGKI